MTARHQNPDSRASPNVASAPESSASNPLHPAVMASGEDDNVNSASSCINPQMEFPPSHFEPVNFPPLQNRLLLDAALAKPDLPRSPVWVMRQAGRYLPEFRQLRSKHGFFEICKTPALAAEITLQPTRRYKGLLDAAIIFSDILVVPQAMGMEVQMLPDVGPHFPAPIRSVDEALFLAKKDYDVKDSLSYVYKAITLTRHLLKGQVPLIGFCGAPWTLMAYMIEGGGSKTFIKAKTFLFTHPEESMLLLRKIGQVAAAFLVEQIRAGAQLVQIFDSWAGELAPRDFKRFELPILVEMLQTVRSAVKEMGLAELVPVTVFAKGANYAIPSLAEAGFDVVGLDWCVDPADAQAMVAPSRASQVALQGNMDPTTLYAGNAVLEETIKEMFLGERGFLSTAEGRKMGHIANLGHGITPAVDPEAMKFFLECVHKYSRRS